jgi:hypothetical protein
MTRNGEQDQMSVTFWAGSPNTTVVVSGATVNDSVIAAGWFRDSNGQGTFSFMTPDGMATGPTVTCTSGTTVSKIEGSTDNGSTFSVTG